MTLRGWGGAGKEGDFTVQEYAKDVERLMLELQVKKAVLVGYDMGSMVAQALALKLPDVVVSMVLFGAAAKLSEETVVIPSEEYTAGDVCEEATRWASIPSASAPAAGKVGSMGEGDPKFAFSRLAGPILGCLLRDPIVPYVGSELCGCWCWRCGVLVTAGARSFSHVTLIHHNAAPLTVHHHHDHRLDPGKELYRFHV